MASPKNTYLRALYDRLGYHATWLPNVPLSLGDVGFVKNRCFVHQTTLHDLGIKVAIRQNGRSAPLFHQSGDDVRLRFKAAGEAPPTGSALVQAHAGVSIEFGRSGAFVFAAEGTTVESIEDKHALGREVLARHAAGKWDRSHVVLTQLVRAERCTVLMANAADSRVELVANADALPNEMMLAAFDSELKVAAASAMQTQIVGAIGITPLFLVAGVRRRVLASTVFRSVTVSHVDAVEHEQYQFGELTAEGLRADESTLASSMWRPS